MSGRFTGKGRRRARRIRRAEEALDPAVAAALDRVGRADRGFHFHRRIGIVTLVGDEFESDGTGFILVVNDGRIGLVGLGLGPQLRAVRDPGGDSSHGESVGGGIGVARGKNRGKPEEKAGGGESVHKTK